MDIGEGAMQRHDNFGKSRTQVRQDTFIKQNDIN